MGRRAAATAVTVVRPPRSAATEPGPAGPASVAAVKPTAVTVARAAAQMRAFLLRALRAMVGPARAEMGVTRVVVTALALRTVPPRTRVAMAARRGRAVGRLLPGAMADRTTTPRAL